ncbi:hypothetical protein ACFWVU_39020 [Streptomyces sp. NPDC058686]|uniref:hypothetical protein n=1 Tax=Streptomyces sp. NPDC058686 TaxID=3346599 RepID=UPI003668778C
MPQTGAPDAWTAGYDGKGVKVAVLDAGAGAGAGAGDNLKSLRVYASYDEGARWIRTAVLSHRTWVPSPAALSVATALSETLFHTTGQRGGPEGFFSPGRLCRAPSARAPSRCYLRGSDVLVIGSDCSAPAT